MFDGSIIVTLQWVVGMKTNSRDSATTFLGCAEFAYILKKKWWLENDSFQELNQGFTSSFGPSVEKKADHK